MRPYVGGDSPLTEPGTIMSPGAEPAVIQHLALNANGRRPLCEFCKVIEIRCRLFQVSDHCGVSVLAAGFALSKSPHWSEIRHRPSSHRRLESRLSRARVSGVCLS
jgi:hypothetical protein